MNSNDTQTSVISLSAVSTAPAFPKVMLNKSQGYIGFGPKNMFPQDIIKYNSRSPVNSAIIRSIVTYICGKGVRDTAADGDRYVGRPNSGEIWDDMIEPIARDYEQFGGFYGQVIVNRGSTTVSIFHQDFSTVRVGTIDETGNPLTFRIAYDWKKITGVNKPLELDVWPGSISKAKKGKAYMFYHWDYEPGLPLYCVPDWFAAMEYVKADGTLGEFYNNSIENGFTPSVVIEMPSNPEEEVRDAFQAKMENAFAGAKGASSIVILWGEGGGVKPNIVPFNASANADIYNNIEGIIFQKIISAHRLSSPTLAGVSGSGNLSGNAAEIIDSFTLLNYTVINQKRRKILDKLNVFQRINKLADLTIEELDVLGKIAQANGTAPAADGTTQLSGKSKLTRMFNAFVREFKNAA